MKHLLLSTTILLAACSGQAELTGGDYADAATTAVGLSQGFVEANPVLAGGGAATPILALGVKYVLKDGLIQAGYDEEEVNNTFDAVGWAGACSNIAVIAGATGGAGIALGLMCGAVAYGDGKGDE